MAVGLEDRQHRILSRIRLIASANRLKLSFVALDSANTLNPVQVSSLLRLALLLVKSSSKDLQFLFLTC